MSNLPPPILEYLYDWIIKSRTPAFLLLEKNGQLKNWGGRLETYGIADLKIGESVEDHILFLQGFFPLDDNPIHLSCVQMMPGITADVHIFSEAQGYWLIFLDATVKEAHIAALQQEANELRLFRDKQIKYLQQYIDLKTTERALRLACGKSGEHKEISVLFADIREFTSYSRHLPASEIFNLLDLYIGQMIQSILDEGGILDKIIGDSIMGIFGILPSGLPHQLRCVKAAFRMMSTIRSLKKDRQIQAKKYFEIGIGIASGEAALGIIGTWDRRKTFSAIGAPINLASNLEKAAQSNEILIDENTYIGIDEFQDRFVKITSERIHIDNLQIFSCEVNND